MVLKESPPASLLDIESLARQFIASTLPREEWTHLAHLAVGLWHVDRYGAAEALDRLRRGIRTLNDSHGTINSASSGYHETITRAYVLLLLEFNERCAAPMPLPERVSRLCKSKLARKDALLNFYSRAALMSEKARAEWVEPDIAPVRLGRLDAAAIEGGCHCGNLHYELLWPQSEDVIAVRNCSCTFCQKHGGAWTSHRDAELEVGIDDTAMVSKYRFGTRTADFYVCSMCGVAPLVACEIDGQLYAVINVRTFKDLPGVTLTSSKSDFDGEVTGDRLSRRQRNWIPRVRITVAR